MNIEIKKVTLTETKPFLSYDSPRWLRVIEHFIRTDIFRQRNYLIDKWTIESTKELEAMHGIDVEEELAKILSEEIEKQFKLELGDDYKTPEERTNEQVEQLKKIYEEYKIDNNK